MQRRVEREWLDELPATDPAARGSRQDLKRLNCWMGHARIMARALRGVARPAVPGRLAELGAGDGDFLLQVARRLDGSWRGTEAILIDRQDVVSSRTVAAFQHPGWHISSRQQDVFAWGRDPAGGKFDLVMANLFVHHFAPEQLTELFQGVQRRTHFFVAVEPRRSALAWVFSNLVGLIGCNAVTRHDAPVSVRAGFLGTELSRCWGSDGSWTLLEERAGLFSHLFVAKTARPPSD
jgi:hypothetical protein